MYTNVHLMPHEYTDAMAQETQELSTRDVRANLAQVINDAAAHGTVTFITSRGRRIAAVVPVNVAETVVEEKGAPPAGESESGES